MDFLRHFNFDFVIITVLLFGIFFYFYRGFVKSAIRLFQLGLFFVVVELINKKLVLLAEFQKFSASINKLINNSAKFFKISELPSLLSVWIIYLIIFIIIWAIISLCKLIFRPSVEKELTHKPKIYSRILGSIIGFVNAYLALVLIIALGFDIIPYQKKGLTRVFVEQSLKISSFENYNYYRLTIKDEYDDLKEAEDYLTNRLLTSITTKIFAIDSEMRNIENDFLVNLDILITSSTAKSLINNHLPTTNLSVAGYTKALLAKAGNQKIYQIVQSEEENALSTNPHLSRLVRYFTFLEQNQIYIELLFAFNEDLTTSNLTSLYNFILDEDNGYLQHFNELSLALEVYQGLNQWIYDQVKDETSGTTYEEVIANVLKDHQKTLALAKKFQNHYQTNFNNPSLKVIGEKYNFLFRQYEKYAKQIETINQNINISNKIILVKTFKDPSKFKLVQNPLLWGYFTDVIDGTPSNMDELQNQMHFILEIRTYYYK